MSFLKKMMFHLFILLLISRLINRSTSCSIFPSLNCSCFQSNFDLSLPLPIKSYSHLYCQGNSLNKRTFQSPFGLDFKYQNRFRTISMEFFIKNSIEIETNQFDSLSMLFSETDNNAQIEISIRFSGFTHIKFHNQSLTSNIFQRKHQNKRLSLHFLPTTSNSIQIESDHENSTRVDDQFTFEENSFSGLIVSQLNLYIHTLRDYFSSSSSFEDVFNNTNIGELHFHGSFIPPGPSHLRRTFKGLVRSLTLHRHVDTIDSNTFPYYFPVYSYNIHSIEAHSLDLDSFIPLYNNFRGLELIKPRFEVSIDKLIPTLDSLSLDIEYLNERTLLGAQHIHNLKLGSRLRRINPQVLYSLPKRLRHFDLSDINLSEMTSDGRCHLINFLSKNSPSQLNIILPRIETLTECDCARLILNDIQLKKKSEENFPIDHFCSTQCRFSDCLIISEYFREKNPLFINDRPLLNILNQPNNDLPSVDLFSDPIDVDMMTFLINQTNPEQINGNSRKSTMKPLTKFQDSQDVIDSISELSDSMNEDRNELLESKRKRSFLLISFSIVCIILFLLVILIVSIIICIVRYRKPNHFKSPPVYV